MSKWRVALQSGAYATVTVECDSDDPEVILEEAYREGVPSVCAQCSGWARDFTLELGEEWEPLEDENGVPEITRVDE